MAVLFLFIINDRMSFRRNLEMQNTMPLFLQICVSNKPLKIVEIVSILFQTTQNHLGTEEVSVTISDIASCLKTVKYTT